MSNCTIHRHTSFNEHVADALLVVAQGQVSDAQDRVEYAEEHADACQEMVSAALRHPTGPRLSVVDGGL
ncbi:MAG: hypothetical protein Q8M17_10710 [Actinomycetota bacterium]|nr:hypothetical protein [Actinomycetota bacterium]